MFKEAMVSIFSDLPLVVVYFDHMLIFSESIENQFQHRKIAFDRLVLFGQYINKIKKQICLNDPIFLDLQ